jgi:hypothetical protein
MANIKYLPVPPDAFFPGGKVREKRVVQTKIEEKKYKNQKRRAYDEFIDNEFPYESTLIEFKKWLDLKFGRAIPTKFSDNISDRIAFVKILLNAGNKYADAAHYYNIWYETAEENHKAHVYNEITDFIEKLIYELSKDLLVSCDKNGVLIVEKIEPKKKVKTNFDIPDEELALTNLSIDYEKVKEILKPWTDQSTGKWADFDKGYRGLAAAVLKDLYNKKYFKKDIPKLTNKRIIEIAKNSFGLKIAIDTVKTSKPEKFPHYLKLIPDLRPNTPKRR